MADQLGVGGPIGGTGLSGGGVLGQGPVDAVVGKSSLTLGTPYMYGHIKLPVVAATIYICSRQVRSLSARSEEA